MNNTFIVIESISRNIILYFPEYSMHTCILYYNIRVSELFALFMQGHVVLHSCSGGCMYYSKVYIFYSMKYIVYINTRTMCTYKYYA